MARTRRKKRKPLPLGAVFLILPILAVILVLLWPSKSGDDAEQGGLDAAPVTEPPRARRAPPAVPSDLLATIERFLRDRRLEVTPIRTGGDLRVELPPGRTPFRIHSELARAAATWGAEIVSARQDQRSGQATRLVITLRRGAETRSVIFSSLKELRDEPRVALVIDDFGYQSADLIESFAALAVRFTPAVLPGYPRSTEAARILVESGHAPILHLPMEPKDYPGTDPGPGAVMTGMAPTRIASILEEHLAGLPKVVGVSNHMGSRACEDRETVAALMESLSPRGIFFLDSGTSEGSILSHEAARRGVACLTADLFLDGEERPDGATMAARLAEARELAESCGSAILIGHARKETRAFLPEAADSLRAWGVRLVPVTDLLR